MLLELKPIELIYIGWAQIDADLCISLLWNKLALFNLDYFEILILYKNFF